jgi:hypothetical protein
LLPFGQAASRALIIVCSTPPPCATCTPTLGLGNGVGEGVGVDVGVFVAAGLAGC